MITYKPYKQKASEWNCNMDEMREDAGGRPLLRVEIGQKVITDDTTSKQIKIEEVEEDVYRDILLGIFTGNDSYVVKTTLGHSPGLVVCYDKRLVMHNDYIPNMVKEILKVADTLDKKTLFMAIANSVLNENGLEKHSGELKATVDEINKKCETNYPAEFIMCVLREYICESSRYLGEQEEEIHYMSYDELLYEVVKVLNNDVDEQRKKYVTNEIMYRFLQGDLTER